MSLKIPIILTTAFLILLIPSQIGIAQGTFQNLDFEAANLSGYTPQFIVPTASAFPGWQALIGNNPPSQALYDNITLGTPSVAIWDAKTGYTPIQGNYTAFLESATSSSLSVNAQLSQAGMVPIGTVSIMLDAFQTQGSSFAVTLGGQTIDMVPLQAFANYTLYGGNISAWAGDITTLSITELAPGNQEFSPSEVQLDNISFSTQTVPEPGPLALTGVGGLLFALYRRFAA